MGLCKCPKRKPSNLFCFEHRVNVCDHCLVTHHPRCVVQTYVKWLQDDDYLPQCHLCNGSLSQGSVIRLECLDVFHVSCIDDHAHSYPPTTAPAGYQCPTCYSPIIPAQNHAGPVVDALRPVLARMKWARQTMGLPPSSDANDFEDDPVRGAGAGDSQSDASVGVPTGASTNSQVIDMTMDRIEESSLARRFYDSTSTNNAGVVSSSGSAGYSHNLPADSDDMGKYERRTATQWMARFLRSRTSLPPSKTSKRRRLIMIIVIGGLGLLTLIIILNQLGRHSTENDPLLDPLANPNIHVN